ncbi:MAG: universal stress protein [Nitrospiraceae bacterium]|nr:MAG: universal stress protein [Nitrospiraceae bacterium]
MNEKINNIILCFDNSDLSLQASEAALDIAVALGSEVVGVHAYNAFMHEGAFRIMEPTLPEAYQKEEILQKQRTVHSTLINVGMEKISLSYLKPVEDSFQSAGVSFRPKVVEGKNYSVINAVLREEDGDLVMIGSSGFNGNGTGFIGSVCSRVLRNNDKNFLIVRKHIDLRQPKFVVCLDGSSSSINALKMADLFAGKFGAGIHLVYGFDSELHKNLFMRLKESVINREGFSFNSKQQEKIHDEFIDKGLARVGNMILDKAEKEVIDAEHRAQSTDIGKGWGLVGEIDRAPFVKKVLEGHIYKRICDYASEINADMIFIGRNGRHFSEGMDIGSVTENVVRFAPCSIFVSQSEKYKGWEL